MKMIKKLAVVIIALIVACFVCGCGSGKEKAPAEKSEQKTEQKTEQSKDDEDSGTEEKQEDKASGSGSEKHITVKVVFKDGSEKEYKYTTNAGMLGEALKENGLVEGIEGDAGLYITTVDGEKADDKNQEWWKVSQNGEMTQMGVDSTEIADGDQFELTFTTGFY